MSDRFDEEIDSRRELKCELPELPRNGSWFLVGDDGCEFNGVSAGNHLNPFMEE